MVWIAAPTGQRETHYAVTDEQSLSFGFLAMYAEDIYEASIGSLNPPADPRIADSGWTIVNYLSAQDALFPPPNAPSQQLTIDPAKRVFFGFLSQSNTDMACTRPPLFACESYTSLDRSDGRNSLACEATAFNLCILKERGAAVG